MDPAPCKQTQLHLTVTPLFRDLRYISVTTMDHHVLISSKNTTHNVYGQRDSGCWAQSLRGIRGVFPPRNSGSWLSSISRRSVSCRLLLSTKTNCKHVVESNQEKRRRIWSIRTSSFSRQQAAVGAIAGQDSERSITLSLVLLSMNG
jgi:hypothetical protein